MKGKRLVATMLALLLVVSLLPMTALAESTFDQNGGKIEEGREVTYNLAQNVTNYGTVTNNGPRASDPPPSIQYNNGTVVNNGGSTVYDKGTVVYNTSGGTVVNNNPEGTVVNNYGLVGEKDENGNLITNGSSGNSGKVEYNQQGGIVTNNTGTVENNNAGATVIDNYGLVGKKDENGLLITDGSFGNFGTVVNNNAGGVVSNNGGTVVSNSGTVCNNTDGSVVKVNEVDGIVSNDSTGPGADGPKVEINFGTVNYPGNDCIQTYYGVHYEDESKNRVYIDQFERNTEVSISKLNISRPGFKLVNCQAVEEYHKSDPNPFEDVTGYKDITTKNDDGSVQSFIIQAPIRLKLVWEKIVTAVASSGGGAEAVPTSYDPDYIGLGSVIFINEKGYKVVEIKDDAFVVVTFDTLPDEDVADLDVLYAKLFTAEQQKLIKNVGQLLDSEDVLTIFGKPGNHPVYEINKSLVE